MSFDPLRPPIYHNRYYCSTSHPLRSYDNQQFKPPRELPKSIYLGKYNPNTALPLSKEQEEADYQYLLPRIQNSNGQNRCQLQQDLLIGMCRACGRYLQDVSGSANMCLTFAVMATGYGIYNPPAYPDFSNQNEILEAVGSKRGRMTSVVDGADAKLALEYGIPMCVVDNHPLYGLTFYITLPTEVQLTKGEKVVPLRDQDCLTVTLNDFDKPVGGRTELVEALAKYAEQRRAPRSREGLMKMTHKEFIMQTLSNPWVLCIYHYGPHYQALIVKDPKTSLQRYPNRYPLDAAAILPEAVKEKYKNNTA